MRVLILNHFPLAGSGSGTYTQNISTYLAEKGHEVCVILPENTLDFEAPNSFDVVPVYFANKGDGKEIKGALSFNFPCFTTHPRSSQTFYDLTDEQLAAYIAAFEAAIDKTIRVFKPDIIHVQHVWVLAWIAMKTVVPYVVTCHGTDLMGYQKSKHYRFYADEAATQAGSIIAISKDNVSLAKETFPQSASKIFYQKNGYSTLLFHPVDVTKEEVMAEYGLPHADYVVLFVGKLAHFKGVDVLLNAARLYEEKSGGRIATIIAGDGELADDLKRHAKKNKLRNVHFMGFVPITRLNELYSMADVAVVPSRREPFGLVAIEALACGCPVVATNQGGLPDIISNEVGSLVDVDDAVGLARAIEREMFNPDRIEKGVFAAQYAEKNYSQARIIDELIGIYNTVQKKTIGGEHEKSCCNSNVLVQGARCPLNGRGGCLRPIIKEDIYDN